MNLNHRSEWTVITERGFHALKRTMLLPVAFIASAGIGISIHGYDRATPATNEQTLGLIDSNTTERDLKISKLPISAQTMDLAISPDGKYVAYRAGNGIRLLDLESKADTNALPDERVWNLQFSPDSKSIYYLNSHGLNRVAIVGGAPAKVVVEDDDTQPAFSPDGTAMAFTRELGGGRDGQAIQLANLDGSNERTVAKIPADHWSACPMFSPDGKTLACLMRFKEGGNFWKVVGFSVADGTQRAISDRKWDAWYGAVWLPNGNLVIAARETPSDFAQLWAIPPGGEPRAVTGTPAFYTGLSATRAGDVLLTVQLDQSLELSVLPDNDAKNARHLITSRFGEIQGRFAWTRDGRIVISSDKTRHRELWIVDSDGNARKQLTTSDSGGADVQPAVSPDGQYVAFTSSRQQGVQHIFRVDLDGTKLRQLTNGAHEELPGFSTDGQWVYFIDGSDDPPSKSVRKVSINGGETLLVTTAPDRWGIKSFDVNRVDGRLALGLERTSNDSQELKLGIVPAQGGEPKLVDVPPKLFPAWPVWTPDGHSIALRSLGQAGEPLDIWSVPVDGTGPPRQLTDLKTLATRNFTWTSDGKQLLVGRETMLTVPVLIRKVGK